MVPDVPAILGKATIGEMKRKSFQKTDIESQVITVEDVQVAGDWGFARGTATTVKKPKTGGAAANINGKFTTIFKKQADGSWKIYWDCMNVDAPSKGQTCQGTLSPGGRWCDNGNGTVTDMTTGLIWLKKANCGGRKSWNDAVSFASWLHDGWTGDGNEGDCGLSDGSGGPEGYGTWRLPTLSELYRLTHGSEAILSYKPGLFSDVQPAGYWSSTTDVNAADVAKRVCLNTGGVTGYQKTITRYVWPVRSEP